MVGATRDERRFRKPLAVSDNACVDGRSRGVGHPHALPYGGVPSCGGHVGFPESRIFVLRSPQGLPGISERQPRSPTVVPQRPGQRPRPPRWPPGIASTPPEASARGFRNRARAITGTEMRY